MNFARSKDGTQIAYDRVGNGPVLIYISGAICHRNFMPILDDVKQFSREFSVVNYDRRGRGDSGDTAPYSLEKEIDDIEALIDAVGGKANLYGHSSGAVLAMEAAVRMPNKIEKVFVYDPPYADNPQEKIKYAATVNKVNALIANKKYGTALRAFLTGIGMPKIFVYLLPLMPGWKKLKALAPTLAYDMELTKDTPPLAHLSKMAVPLHIAHGQKSPSTIKAVARTISESIRSSKLIEVPKQDHMVSAKVLLPLFKEFFK